MHKLHPLLVFFWLCSHLLGQSPLSYQRDNNTPMVAEAGGATSHGVNPAGLYRFVASPDTQISILLGGTSLGLGLPLLDNLLGGNPDLPDFQSVRFLGLMAKLLDWQVGNADSDETTRDLLEFIGPTLYQITVEGIPGLPTDPKDLTADHLEKIADHSQTLERNLGKDNLAQKLTDKVVHPAIEELVDLLGPWMGVRFYYDLLRLRFSQPAGSIAWGLDFDARLKITSSLEPQTKETLAIPLAKDSDDYLYVNMPFNVQIYQQLGVRASFAGPLTEVEGLRWGVSPHLSVFAGINHRDLASSLTEAYRKELQQSGTFSKSILPAALQKVWGLNPGLDLGLIYNFGPLIPALDFLNIGLQLRDAIGFVIQPESEKPVEYSIDADLGAFLNKKLADVRLFGGVELVAIRGWFQANPRSELVKPLEHLRLLAGVAFLDDSIKVSLQYYDHFLSPSLDFWLGIVRFGFRGDIDLGASQVVGLGFHLNFRSTVRDI